MAIEVIRDGADLPPAQVLAAVRAAFAALARGEAAQPAQLLVPLAGGGDVITYPGLVEPAGVYGVKVSPYLPQPGGPALVTAWTLLISLTTGEPVLLCDAKALTAQRTAATSALAVDLLARPGAATLAVIGGGPLARAHVRYARQVRPFTDIRVATRSGRVDLAAFTAEAGDVPVRAVASAAEAADGADVVLACTSAAQPVLDVAALPAGTVVTSISTNAPDAHEVDPAALAGLEVYCDHRPSATAAAGEMRLAVRRGLWSADAVRGDLAGLVGGSDPGPTGSRVVFFRSVGLGIEDIAIAGLLSRS
ncbi:NAD(P)H-dependent anabolic L-arginine dehydrogenase DauB [Catellatospora sp. TT07R-123]|uniref:ornithine cyclodeaminase family protein n=1 Tax=Catellatospora sp. TT07R-123 TaxID=2733863 RepID=UPI001B04D547|nr:ornithine cyclodeaminase family protein [Catellatospora sp. TT07R-123]GHJ44547.1 NAD(P)H-dependent anabolic L-arginine dehydrogenase DauB [Catellatospora sp. TT07R-123]